MLEQHCQMEATLREKLQQQLNDNAALTATLFNQVMTLTKTTEAQASRIQQLLTQQKSQSEALLIKEERLRSYVVGNSNETNNNNTDSFSRKRKMETEEHHHHFPAVDSPDNFAVTTPAIKRAANTSSNDEHSTESEIVRHEISIERTHRTSFATAVAGSDSELEETDIDSDIEDLQPSPSPGKEEGIKRKVHSTYCCH